MAVEKTASTTRAGSPVDVVSAHTPDKRPASPRAARKKAQPTANPQATTPVSEDLIRVRAYYLSLDRDGDPADPFADWLRAERELASAG